MYAPGAIARGFFHVRARKVGMLHRYHLDDAAFKAATAVSGVPAPKAPGQAKIFTVTYLLVANWGM